MSEQTHAEWLRENAAFFEQCNENLDVGSLSPEDIARMRLVATEMEGPLHLTPDEFDLLKDVFRRAGGGDLGSSVSCAKKAEELMDAITKRTGLGFEQYT